MTRPRLLDLKGGTVLIDEADWPLVGPLTVYVGTNGYAYFSVWEDDGRSWPTTLHSFLMGGARPGHHIDHRNGNPLDNRRSNLRFVSYQQNGVNRHRLNRNNRSGIRGVQRTSLSASKPWRAQITVNRKNLHLGLFATEREAVDARRTAELEHYGEVCP